MDKQLTHAVMWMNGLSRGEIVNWLGRAFFGGDFSPLHLTDEPSAVEQVLRLFKRVPFPTQEDFKDALATILAEWSPALGPGPLLQLIVLAADVRAARTALVIGKHLREDVNALPEPARIQIAGKLVSVLRSFAGDPPAGEVLYTVFYSLRPAPDPRLAGQLFLGLCEASPETYPLHVRRFRLLAEQLPDREHTFPIDVVMAKFASAVTLQRIVDLGMRLTTDEWIWLLKMLTDGAQAPAILRLGGRLEPRPWFAPPDEAVQIPAELLMRGANEDYGFRTLMLQHQVARQQGGPPASLLQSFSEVYQ